MIIVGYMAFGRDGKPWRPMQRRGSHREQPKPMVTYTTEAIARGATHQDDIRPIFVGEKSCEA